MATNSTTEGFIQRILFSSIVILYLCIGFVPNWGAVDKIAPQWLALSIINLSSTVVFLIYRKELIKNLRLILSSSVALFYCGFFLWSTASYFYAINPTEVLVNLPRHLNTLLMYLFIGVFIGGVSKKERFFSWVITIILGIEVYAVLEEAFLMIEKTGVISSGTLKGVTANRNITAFSIVIKIPFVIYLMILQSKKKWIQVLQGLLIMSSLVCISIIQSRAAFVASGLILIIFLSICIYFFSLTKEKKWMWYPTFYILPLIISLFINSFYFSNKGASALDRASTISISTNDGSVNQRLRYYEDVLMHMIDNPFLGTGLGNWKIKSIDYDKNDIRGYVVPYHAHSDFIQLGAELGVIGFLLYLGIFVLTVVFVFKLFFSSKTDLNQKLFLGLMLTSLSVYSVDANLNFPIARPQVLAPWALVMAMITFYYQSIFKREFNSIPNGRVKRVTYNSIPFFVLLLIIPSIKITNTTYKSLKAQMLILQDFNSNKYNLPLNQVESFIPTLPNITVTTIPMNAIKARYYFHYKKYEKALSSLNKDTNANPYLFFSELLKSQIFQEKGKIDSAYVYAKKAFYGLPNNDLHASNYLNLVFKTRDKAEIQKAFEYVNLNQNENIWKNYLIVASGLYPQKDIELINRAKTAMELFPNNPEIKNLYRQISVGIKGIKNASSYSQKGLEYFNNKDYFNAAKQFELALKNDPLDYAHFENAATSNYLLGDLDKAQEQIDIVINELNPLNGKCEYIKALIFIRMGDQKGACPFLKTAVDSGFSQANATFIQYCK